MTDITTIKCDVAKVQSDHNALQQTVSGMQTEILTLKSDVDRLKGVESNYNVLKEAFCRSQVNAVKQQYKSMEYNIIVRNYPEHIAVGDKQETEEKSLEHATNIIHDVFGIDRAINIALVTAHRLPTTKPGHKPPIFKLAKLSDKQTLWKNISNIKRYNSELPDRKKVFIQMIQLPEKLAKDRKSLQADYDTARSNGRDPKWHYLKKSGTYCYKIGNTVYKPTVDHFIHKYIGESVQPAD